MLSKIRDLVLVSLATACATTSTPTADDDGSRNDEIQTCSQPSAQIEVVSVDVIDACNREIEVTLRPTGGGGQIVSEWSVNGEVLSTSDEFTVRPAPDAPMAVRLTQRCDDRFDTADWSFSAAEYLAERTPPLPVVSLSDGQGVTRDDSRSPQQFYVGRYIGFRVAEGPVGDTASTEDSVVGTDALRWSATGPGGISNGPITEALLTSEPGDYRISVQWCEEALGDAALLRTVSVSSSLYYSTVFVGSYALLAYPTSGPVLVYLELARDGTVVQRTVTKTYTPTGGDVRFLVPSDLVYDISNVGAVVGMNSPDTVLTLSLFVNGQRVAQQDNPAIELGYTTSVRGQVISMGTFDIGQYGDPVIANGYISGYQ